MEAVDRFIGRFLGRTHKKRFIGHCLLLVFSKDGKNTDYYQIHFLFLRTN